MIRSSLAIALFCFASLTLTVRADDVYLLGGQSNMDGRGKAVELTDQQRQPIGGASIFYRNPPACSEKWMPLTPGYSIAPGYKGGLPSPTFGPEIGFAMAMTKARPGTQLALIKGSKGGTSLSKDWNPGVKGQPDTQGPCYRNFLETINMATAQLKQQNRPFVIRGMLWHQGEADASSPSEVYEQRLTALIARIREDLNLPDMPFVIGEVFDNGKRDRVRTAQRAVAEKVRRTGFASAEGTKCWDNGTHFDVPSQLLLGQRFATAMLQIEAKP